MVEAALRASSVEVWAYLELRYHAPFLAMHELVAAGQIGEVVSLQATLPPASAPSRAPRRCSTRSARGVSSSRIARATGEVLSRNAKELGVGASQR